MTTQPTKVPRLSSTGSDSDPQPQSSTQSAVPGPTPTYRPAGQPGTLINPKVIRPGDITRIREEQKESKHRDKTCPLCSSRKTKVNHHRDGRAARARARLEPILSSLTGSAQLEYLSVLSHWLGSARSFQSSKPFGSAQLGNF